MRFKIRTLFVLIAFCWLSQTLFLSVKARTVTIDEDNFERRVANSGLVWALEFSSSSCGSCIEFKPRWEAGAAQLEAIGVRTGVVEVDDPAGMKLARSLGVLDAGLPAVRDEPPEVFV